MSTMIMDLCSYTRLGLTGYLTSRGIKKQEIVEVNNAADLQKHCTSCCPAVVFLNEDCFVHDDESNGIIRQTITQNPDGEGCATFTCNGGSVSVWVLEEVL